MAINRQVKDLPSDFIEAIRYFNEPNTKKYLLERIQHVHQVKVPAHMLDTMTIDTYRDFFQDTISLAIMGYMASNKDTKETINSTDTSVEEIAKYPETIWDYFKEKYLPDWFIKKYPVQYIVYDKKTTIVKKTVTNNTKIFPDITLQDTYKLVRILENPYGM